MGSFAGLRGVAGALAKSETLKTVAGVAAAAAAPVIAGGAAVVVADAVSNDDEAEEGPE